MTVLADECLVSTSVFSCYLCPFYILFKKHLSKGLVVKRCGILYWLYEGGGLLKKN